MNEAAISYGGCRIRLRAPLVCSQDHRPGLGLHLADACLKCRNMRGWKKCEEKHKV